MNNNENLSPIYSIVTPTILQADRLADGSFSVSVSQESHAPSHAYITVEDYLAHERAGLITINFMEQPTAFGYVRINYTVN